MPITRLGQGLRGFAVAAPASTNTLKGVMDMSLKHVIAAAVGVLMMSGSASAALVVDRGLPDTNLNNAAGADRSNVAWAFTGEALAGDDFTLPEAKKWRIDKISLWTIGGQDFLGDRFESVSLFLGTNPDDVPKVTSANITTGSNDTNNPNVTVTKVTYPNTTETYQGSGGALLNIWQVDFENLGHFTGGEHFFAFAGVGSDPDNPNSPLSFNHASNAALSGTPQDGSDDQFIRFSGTGLQQSIAFHSFQDSNQQNFWDKSSDINIQVYGELITPVTEPATLAVLGLGLAGLGLAARRRRLA